MPACVIDDLSKRGAWAGALLTERFGDTPPADVELTWDNHRWVRYRASMAALERLLEAFHKGYANTEEGQRSYGELLTRSADDLPSSYRWKTLSRNGEPIQAQQEYAQEITRLLIELAEEIGQGEEDLQKGSPRPRPALRIVPDV